MPSGSLRCSARSTADGRASPACWTRAVVAVAEPGDPAQAAQPSAAVDWAADLEAVAPVRSLVEGPAGCGVQGGSSQAGWAEVRSVAAAPVQAEERYSAQH